MSITKSIRLVARRRRIVGVPKRRKSLVLLPGQRFVAPGISQASAGALVLAMIARLIGYEAVNRFLSLVPIHFRLGYPNACFGWRVWLLSGGNHYCRGHYVGSIALEADGMHMSTHAGALQAGEEIFGWIKTVGNFRRTRYRAVERTSFAAFLVAAAYDLLRIAKLCRTG